MGRKRQTEVNEPTANGTEETLEVATEPKMPKPRKPWVFSVLIRHKVSGAVRTLGSYDTVRKGRQAKELLANTSLAEDGDIELWKMLKLS